MSLSEYLAKNYLTADPKPEKKSKKRKRKDVSEGVTIADDDPSGWKTAGTQKDDEYGPVTVSSTSTEFRKSRSSNWQTLSGAPATLPTTASNRTSDDAAATAILASAAAEASARAAAANDDEAPALDPASIPLMSSGARAGLQTASQLAAQLVAAKAADAAADPLLLGAGGKSQETIYRDASGRVVNVAMKRAEARAKAAEAERKKEEEKERAKGDVQRRQKEERRRELEEAKYMPFARGVDDEEMNRELKSRVRWGDPGAGLILGEDGGGAGAGGGGRGRGRKGEEKSVSGMPLYKGAAPPNRYGIRPGHRWDGVDRGIGFEGEWFRARNKEKNKRELEFHWQMDE